MVGQPPRVDLPLGSIADLQGGVVTRAQARAAGLLRSEIGYLARRSAWEPIRRGMYAEPGGGASVRIGSALLATGSRGVASHGSAAALLGLDLLRDPDATQTVLTVRPGQRGHRDLDGIRVHRAGLPPWHVSEVNGLPVTTVARTLVDLTRALSLRDGVVAMDAALHSGRVRLEQLEEVLADCRGWPWIRRAASAVKLTDPAAESALESLSRMFFSAHDIPAPVTQFVVRSGQLFIARTTSGGRSRGSPVKPTDSESTPHLPTCTPRSYGRSGSRHWASGSSAGPGTTSGNRRRPGLRRLGSELPSAGPLEPAAAAHLAAGIHLCLPQATTRRTVHRRVGARGRQSGHGTADPGSRRGTQTDAAEN